MEIKGKLKRCSDSEQPELGVFSAAACPVAAGEVLVRERYLTFVTTPLEARRGHKHLETYRAVSAVRINDGSLEGSSCGAWGACCREIREAGFHIGDAVLESTLREELADALQVDSTVLTQEEFEDAVHLARVFHQNSFSFAGEDGLRNDIVFPTISRVNHSCSPNAVLQPTSSSSEAQLVALRPIEEGETVEICYCPTQYLLRNTEQRRAVLEAKWGFCCRCSRCELPVEAARSFSVPCSKCSAKQLLLTHGPSVSPSMTCTACGALTGVDGAEVARVLEEEAALEVLVQGLPDPEDLELPAESGLDSFDDAVRTRWAFFAATHPEHRLALEFWRRHAADLHAQGLFEEAAAAQDRFVAGAERLLSVRCEGMAWLVELRARRLYLRELAGRPQEEVRDAFKSLLRSMSCSMGGRLPPPAMLFDMIQCPIWWKLLQRVGSARP